MLVTNKKQLLMHATIWMNLKYIMLSERSKTHMAAYCIMSFIQLSENTKLQKRKQIGARGRGQAVCKGT